MISRPRRRIYYDTRNPVAVIEPDDSIEFASSTCDSSIVAAIIGIGQGPEHCDSLEAAPQAALSAICDRLEGAKKSLYDPI